MDCNAAGPRTADPAESRVRPAPSPARARTDRGRALEAVLNVLAGGRIEAHFQPVIDLFAAAGTGHEALSRFPDCPIAPGTLFAAAHEEGLAWEFEQVCRRALLHRLAECRRALERRMLFVNVGLDVFLDPRFPSEWNAATVQRCGIDPQQVVLDIHFVRAPGFLNELEEATRRMTGEGFRIALDDYGAGEGSLGLLLALEPQFLRIDRPLVADIDAHAAQQRLLRRIVTVAGQIGCRLIAEGVETREELAVLTRQGVRYAQGFYFQAPQATPAAESAAGETLADLETIVCGVGRTAASQEHAIEDLTAEPPVFPRNAITCEGLEAFFRKRPELDHVLIRMEDRSYGLVTRDHFYGRVAGPFGYSLFQKKSIEALARHDPLVVPRGIDIAALSRLAMNRQREELYDPVIVTREDGSLLGTITMQQLLNKSIDLEVTRARCANPLTRLPGNTMIRGWLREALEHPPFTVIYGDLDSFKEYNDIFGFPKGDKMIKLAASVLERRLKEISIGARLGHLGGDDFVVVAPERVPADALALVCRTFDEEKLSLFPEDAVVRGGYDAAGRDGEPVEAKLVTLSLAVLSDENVGEGVAPDRFGEMAAALKKKIKRINHRTGRSGYLFDQRNHATRPGRTADPVPGD